LNHRFQDNREAADPSNPDRSPIVSPDRSRGGVDPAALARAREATAAIAKSHYENFLVASVLLPRRLRQPFFDVYAFCRTADDLADESPSPEIATERLADFQRHLDAAFAGRPQFDGFQFDGFQFDGFQRDGFQRDGPQHDLFVALADTATAFDLPQTPFDDLLDAFRQDQTKTRYATFDELTDYCRRSANPVGRIVLMLARAADSESIGLSDEICTGLQLANFWQDVARDFAIGRLYLPATDCDEYGVTESMIAQGIAARTTPPELRRLIHFQCDRAEGFFRRGLPLAERVPRWLAADVRLFAHGGLATLAAIRRVDGDVLRVRPKVAKTTQMAMLARAAIGWL
jgi:squalene synthase HpnC